jgi:hypothetical protein
MIGSMRGLVLTAVAVSVAIAGGLVVLGLAGSGSTWPTYHSVGIVLQYPPSWRATNYSDAVSNVSYSLVFLSDQPMHDPCRTSTDERFCGDVIDQLRDGGVLVEWFAWGFPGWRYLNVGPGAITVGGRPARILRLRVTACRGLGANAHEIVEVGAPMATEGFLFTACYRGGDSRIAQRQLSEILGSTRFLEQPQ